MRLLKMLVPKPLSVDLEILKKAYHVFLEHIAIHNHPSGNIFTHTDIRTFFESYNLQILSAVGNDGMVFTLEKTKEYDGLKFAQSFMPVIEKYSGTGYNDINEYLKDIMNFLMGADKFGAKFNRG